MTVLNLRTVNLYTYTGTAAGISTIITMKIEVANK